MKKFIIKSIPFLIPFFMAYLCNLYLGVRNEGDLFRIGNFINNDKNYRSIFKNHFLLDTIYDDFSNPKKRNYTALILGDSFSNQGNIGYQNFLAKYDSVSVLHFNQSSNSIELLHEIINGDILDSIHFEYIIIQSVERSFVQRANNFDSTKVINFNQAIKRDKEYKIRKKEKMLSYEKPPRFFSESTIKFPLINLLYTIDDNAFSSPVYRVKTEKKLFSNMRNDLLFYKDDLLNIGVNNNLDKIKIANERLNSLSLKLNKKGIKLFVLISPDKYDIYFKYINKKHEKYPEPLFYNYFSKLDKNYIYIDLKEILSNSIKLQKDIYFYEDSHWSSFATELIASRIYEAIIDECYEYTR